VKVYHDPTIPTRNNGMGALALDIAKQSLPKAPASDYQQELAKTKQALGKTPTTEELDDDIPF
jgi:hypothetical protein